MSPSKKTTNTGPAKTRGRKLKVLPDEKPLTPEELEKFRNALLEKRMEIIGDVDSMSNKKGNDDEEDNTPSELSNMPIHMADIGTDNYEQEFTLGLIESDRKLLMDIDRALIKMNEGNYGICEISDRQIPRARLKAKPEARYHIEIARQIEQGLLQVPQDSGNGNGENEDED